MNKRNFKVRVVKAAFDQDWKYIKVRRYVAYLEHSVDRGTQFVAFENNGPALWNKVQTAIEDFLMNEWANGALAGKKSKDAFFVRCNRTTMTQNDLDNGRLVCMVGVALFKPAEFVNIRIERKTKGRRQKSGDTSQESGVRKKNLTADDADHTDVR